MGYMKIKLKETANRQSVKTKYFSIDKGEIVTVPDDVKIDPQVFDIVEKNGKTLIKTDKLRDVDIQRMLHSGKVEDIIAQLKKADISYNDVQAVLKVEAARYKRKDLMEYLMKIPEPEDIGTEYGNKQVWHRELMAIKELSHTDALNVITVYPTKEDLLKALSKEQNIPFESDIEDALRREYKKEVKKETVPKNELKKNRVEMQKKASTGTTTKEHFKFIKKEEENKEESEIGGN